MPDGCPRSEGCVCCPRGARHTHRRMPSDSTLARPATVRHRTSQPVRPPPSDGHRKQETPSPRARRFPMPSAENVGQWPRWRLLPSDSASAPARQVAYGLTTVRSTRWWNVAAGRCARCSPASPRTSKESGSIPDPSEHRVGIALTLRDQHATAGERAPSGNPAPGLRRIDWRQPPVPNCRVNFTNTLRCCGRTQLKKPVASRPSLSTTKSPVPAVLSQPKRTFADQIFC